MKRGFFDFFPTPIYLKMPAAGLDVSDGSVRCIELAKKGGKYSVKSFGEEKLNQGTIDSGLIQDRRDLQKALEALKKKLSLRFVKLSLPEEKGFVFEVELPKMNESDIHDAVRLKIEENIPVSSTDVVYECSIESVDAANQKMSVHVIAYPIAVIESYMEVLKSAGLVPISCEVDSKAIANAIIREGDRSTYMIVDLGDLKTGIYIVSDSKVMFTSTFNAGMSTVESNPLIFSSHNVLNSIDAKPISSSVSTTTVKSYVPLALRNEVSKLVDYWSSRKDSKNRQISKIILCGEGVKSEEFDLKFAAAVDVKIPVVLADVWSNAFSLDEHIPEISFLESFKYAAAVGLSF